jgi:hypothetical protein
MGDELDEENELQWLIDNSSSIVEARVDRMDVHDAEDNEESVIIIGVDTGGEWMEDIMLTQSDLERMMIILKEHNQ